MSRSQVWNEKARNRKRAMLLERGWILLLERAEVYIHPRARLPQDRHDVYSLWGAVQLEYSRRIRDRKIKAG